MKLLDTTPARVLVIAVTTIAVGILLIGIAFLSSGSNGGLIPPWQLFAAEAVSVAVLLVLSHSTLMYKKDRSIYQAALVISLVLLVLVSSFVGIGHTWSPLSVVGKAIATFLTLAYPILISAVAIVLMRRRSANLLTQWVTSIGISLISTVPMIFVGITLACFTGDCL